MTRRMKHRVALDGTPRVTNYATAITGPGARRNRARPHQLTDEQYRVPLDHIRPARDQDSSPLPNATSVRQNRRQMVTQRDE